MTTKSSPISWKNVDGPKFETGFGATAASGLAHASTDLINLSKAYGESRREQELNDASRLVAAFMGSYGGDFEKLNKEQGNFYSMLAGSGIPTAAGIGTFENVLKSTGGAYKDLTSGKLSSAQANKAEEEAKMVEPLAKAQIGSHNAQAYANTETGHLTKEQRENIQRLGKDERDADAASRQADIAFNTQRQNIADGFYQRGMNEWLSTHPNQPLPENLPAELKAKAGAYADTQMGNFFREYADEHKIPPEMLRKSVYFNQQNEALARAQAIAEAGKSLDAAARRSEAMKVFESGNVVYGANGKVRLPNPDDWFVGSKPGETSVESVTRALFSQTSPHLQTGLQKVFGDNFYDSLYDVNSDVNKLRKEVENTVGLLAQKRFNGEAILEILPRMMHSAEYDPKKMAQLTGDLVSTIPTGSGQAAYNAYVEMQKFLLKLDEKRSEFEAQVAKDEKTRANNAETARTEKDSRNRDILTGRRDIWR
jgi:hypothetical protein